MAARTTLLEAAREAARAGDDWQVANTWTFLVLVVGLGLGRFDEAEGAATLERPWALCQPDRLSPTPTRLRCLALAGRLRVVEGRPSDAVGPLERAIAGWERMSSRERALGETLRDLAAARRALSDPAGADAAAERAARLLAVAPPRTA